jgi:hypothetical protein
MTFTDAAQKWCPRIGVIQQDLTNKAALFTGPDRFLIQAGFEKERMTIMYISLAYSRTHGFLKWSESHRPGNDDDEPGGATPIAINKLHRDEREDLEEPPHQPWLVPGVGTSF